MRLRGWHLGVTALVCLLVGLFVGWQLRGPERARRDTRVKRPEWRHPVQAAQEVSADDAPAAPTASERAASQASSLITGAKAGAGDFVRVGKHVRIEVAQRREKGRWLDGKRDGNWRTYASSGALVQEQYYVRGQREGRWTQWHENGALAAEGEYRAGKREGRFVYWDEGGHRVREGVYEQGVLVAPEEVWDPTGRFPTPDKAAHKARVDGKYSRLLLRLAVPEDRASYQEFRDYGEYGATTYKGHAVPRGYWVYVWPYWFIWGETR